MSLWGPKSHRIFLIVTFSYFTFMHTYVRVTSYHPMHT